MTGVHDQSGHEIKEGDIVEFSGRKFRVVFLQEGAHNGFYAQELLIQNGEAQIHRILLLAINPSRMKVV